MSDNFIDEIQKSLERISTKKVGLESVGKVIEVKDGIVLADGLGDIGANEIVEIETSKGNKVKGLALNLEEEIVGIIVLGSFEKIQEGNKVSALGKQLEIRVDEKLLGRVINPLGEELDGQGAIEYGPKAEYKPFEKLAPGVIDRQDVFRPLQTGVKAIDALIPIGRGQRELIIGDRQTGKTAIAIDAIINQKSENVICIYVAIGQKSSKIAQIRSKLATYGALPYTIIVSTSAADPAALQYLAPFIGTAIGEYFAEKGKDALIVYDDLTKHAWAYREISLLLRRPAGREAYPGDIFYLHSRLLERSSQLSKDNGGGSLTALPIVETQAGDVSAYIPTNIISITDGQIYLESDLFNSGIRPAVNAGLSVSRVGGAAQTKGMKQVAGQLRLDLAMYRELAAFAQFGSEIDEETKKTLKRGEVMTELLKQPQYEPVSIAEQILILFAGTQGYLSDIPKDEIKEWENEFCNYAKRNYTSLLKQLGSGPKIDEELKEKVISVIKAFIKSSRWGKVNPPDIGK